jgi:hypothetical protein
VNSALDPLIHLAHAYRLLSRASQYALNLLKWNSLRSYYDLAGRPELELDLIASFQTQALAHFERNRDLTFGCESRGGHPYPW